MSVVQLLVIGQGACICDDLIRLHGQEHLVLAHEIHVGSGLARAINESFDIVLIDDPAGDFEVLRDLREQSEVPIIVLTDENKSPIFRVRSLQLGADECLCKPVVAEELVARIRALLRRVASSWKGKTDSLVCGDLRFSPSNRRVYRRGHDLGLTEMESVILEHLIRSQGVAVSRDVLAVRLYGRQCSPFERTVDTHISRIRKKLGDDKDLIISIRGNGYQLSVPAE